MVEVIIGGKLTRNFKGTLGRIGRDPLEENLIVGKLDSLDKHTQIQLHWNNKTELELLRDRISAVLVGMQK